MDSNQRKLTLADLQSAPFSHSGIYPYSARCGADVWGGGLDLTRENNALSRKNFSSGKPAGFIARRRGRIPCGAR